MKKFVSLSLVAAVIILTGCQQSSEKFSNNQLFEKKNLCASYKDKIAAELEKRSKNALIGEVFYSPSLNTCLYTAIFPFEEDGKFYGAYSIEDYLENKQIFRCVSEDPNDQCDIEHEKQVEELKNNF